MSEEATQNENVKAVMSVKLFTFYLQKKILYIILVWYVMV